MPVNVKKYRGAAARRVISQTLIGTVPVVVYGYDVPTSYKDGEVSYRELGGYVDQDSEPVYGGPDDLRPLAACHSFVRRFELLFSALSA